VEVSKATGVGYSLRREVDRFDGHGTTVGGRHVTGSDDRAPATSAAAGEAEGTAGRPALIATRLTVVHGLDAFWDPRFEYRRLFAEAWGTFLLVLIAAGTAVVAALPSGSDVTLLMKVLAPGLMVTAIVYFMGTVSGAHINPAVTIAFASRRQFPWRRVPGYLIAQIVGATLAAFVLEMLFGGIANGQTVPGEGIDPVVAVATEFLLTLGLLSVVLGVVDGPRNVGVSAALAFGFYIALAGMFGATISGASMNPARTLGPDLIAGDLSQLWIYIVGPIAGALVAVMFDRLLHGPPSPAGAQAAQGLLSREDPGAL
jgi:aquaporin Z